MTAVDGVTFEDFQVGQEFLTAGVTVTETHLVNWANLTGDWYPLHMDEEFARAHTDFGRRLVHGPFVFALSVGLIERANVLGRSVIAWLGTDEMRAKLPVFIGDTLSVRATVLEARRSRSEPGRGIVTLLYEARKHGGEVVMSFRSTLMIRASQTAA